MTRQRKTKIGKKTIKRIIKSKGAERISKGAVDQLTDDIIDEVERIAENAVELARLGGRKTVMKKDIKVQKSLN